MGRRIANKQCAKCRYGMMLEGIWLCGYILDTGHMRGCPIHPKCAKYEPKEDKRRRRKNTSYTANAVPLPLKGKAKDKGGRVKK